MPLLGKIYDLLDYMNVIETLRPVYKQFTRYFYGDMVRDLDDIDKMASPRVLRSHLPLSLLNPKLLDTCKVINSHFYFWINYL